jgi:cytoskeletal protein RodZ
MERYSRETGEAADGRRRKQKKQRGEERGRRKSWAGCGWGLVWAVRLRELQLSLGQLHVYVHSTG